MAMLPIEQDRRFKLLPSKAHESTPCVKPVEHVNLKCSFGSSLVI